MLAHQAGIVVVRCAEHLDARDIVTKKVELDGPEAKCSGLATHGCRRGG